MGDEKGIVIGVIGEKSENLFYLIFSADNSGVLIISVQLKGENYSEWVTEMMNVF